VIVSPSELGNYKIADITAAMYFLNCKNAPGAL
jgi:hypothetical protein